MTFILLACRLPEEARPHAAISSGATATILSIRYFGLDSSFEEKDIAIY